MPQTKHGAPAPAAATTAQLNAWAVGWAMFAAVMMVIQGCWWFIAGLVALFNDTFYVVGEEYIFQFDVTTWGWIHVLVGLVVLAAGIGLFRGTTWARVVGILAASIAMLVAFAWIPWYPIWALLFVAISVAVIWALTAHGRDLSAL